MTEEQKKRLSALARVCFEEPMKEHVSFRTGGPAEAYVKPNEDELKDILLFAREEGIPVCILGNGSNVLVRDEGIRGLVISMAGPVSEIRVSENEIYAQGGAMLSAVANAACAAGLCGLEFAGGIPGSVGGAVVMNAGAYGGEISDVLISVDTMDLMGNRRSYQASELNFGYRSSRFIRERTSEEIVLSARFGLKKADPVGIRKKMDELNQKRMEKQPLKHPSAGSTFKRPEGFFAGKLIEEAGLAGYTVGGAMVSKKHCGFVINTGGASSNDILSVISHVKEEVERTSGVRLKEEVRII